MNLTRVSPLIIQISGYLFRFIDSLAMKVTVIIKRLICGFLLSGFRCQEMLARIIRLLIRNTIFHLRETLSKIHTGDIISLFFYFIIAANLLGI